MYFSARSRDQRRARVSSSDSGGPGLRGPSVYVSVFFTGSLKTGACNGEGKCSALFPLINPCSFREQMKTPAPATRVLMYIS